MVLRDVSITQIDDFVLFIGVVFDELLGEWRFVLDDDGRGYFDVLGFPPGSQIGHERVQFLGGGFLALRESFRTYFYFRPVEMVHVL